MNPSPEHGRYTIRDPEGRLISEISREIVQDMLDRGWIEPDGEDRFKITPLGRAVVTQ